MSNFAKNETLKTILKRRSIRNFKLEQIKDEELLSILEAAKYAPSAMGQQPWHFTVIQSKEVIAKLNEFGKKVFLNSGVERFVEWGKAANFSLIYHAPTYIIVSGDVNAIAPVNDISLAIGNMFIAAESLGLGTVWIHAVNHLKAIDEGRKLFKELRIPEGYEPFGSLALGYNGGDIPEPAPRREGTVNIIK
ncbi:nitroreductase family protein [Pseudobacteroides cellulosolvens]|uniref:Nitroreductase n=1 Tax=Pseudobacteroides cellulosolvens ATCC 35603 = DSM 2933 TaxID=398512 RepID=A0A0L6JGD7_9FIRM|nr:nitroreductase family protein [Pseudobacteroides cellulosolvens]KNY24764.1 nitroreductase [Pseudobacteroides cellulosolvens ATCC 35603 = DSM 2933]